MSLSVRGEGQIHATAELETEIGPGFTDALATAPRRFFATFRSSLFSPSARSPDKQAGVELGDISEHDLHIVDAAVVDQRNRCWIHRCAVKRGLPDASASARRIGHRDLVAGVEELPDDLVLRPRRRDAGIDPGVSSPWLRRALTCPHERTYESTAVRVVPMKR